MPTARKVENACRSRPLARTTSMPAGQRSRTAASAAVLLELEAGDEAADVVSLLLLIEPIRVGVVVDGLLLGVLELARVGLLNDLVPGGEREPIVLLTQLAGFDGEELVLGREVGEHPAGEPAHVATLVLRRAVFGVLLRDFREVRAGIERFADRGDLLELIGEGLEVTADRTRRPDLYLRDVDLSGRRDHPAILLPLGERVAEDVVLCVTLDVGL